MDHGRVTSTFAIERPRDVRLSLERIFADCKAKGLTQEQLAYESGVAMRYVAGVERGEENPSLRYLVKLAKSLEVEPGALWERRA